MQRLWAKEMAEHRYVVFSKGLYQKINLLFFQSRYFVMDLHKRLTCWFHLRKRPGAYPVNKYSGFIVCIL